MELSSVAANDGMDQHPDPEPVRKTPAGEAAGHADGLFHFSRQVWDRTWGVGAAGVEQ